MKNEKLLLLALFSCVVILSFCALGVNSRRLINVAKEIKYSKNNILKARSAKNKITQSEVLSSAEPANGVDVGKKYVLPVKTQAQQKWFWCAPTTVSMILASRGVNISQSQLASEMGTYEPFGTHNENAVRVLNRYLFGYETPKSGQSGYRLEKITSSSGEELGRFKERIVKNTKDGYPLYLTVDLAKLYPGRSNPAEHNIVGAGYISTPDDKDVALIYIVDPYSKFHNSVNGGLKIFKPEEVLEAAISSAVTELHYAW